MSSDTNKRYDWLTVDELPSYVAGEQGINLYRYKQWQAGGSRRRVNGISKELCKPGPGPKQRARDAAAAVAKLLADKS